MFVGEEDIPEPSIELLLLVFIKSESEIICGDTFSVVGLIVSGFLLIKLERDNTLLSAVFCWKVLSLDSDPPSPDDTPKRELSGSTASMEVECTASSSYLTRANGMQHSPASRA